MKRQNTTKGLSLVEVLVAMTLMTVLITVIATPLAGLFQYSKDSREVIEANANARSALETARASWQTYPWANPSDPNSAATNNTMQNLNIASLWRYNTNCFGPEIQPLMNNNITFSIHQLDRDNEILSDLDSSNVDADCGTLTQGPQMLAKRIVVHVTDDDGSTTILTHVDVRAPTTVIPGS